MLWLNIFVAVDLINMIKYPFKPKASQFYLLFSFLSSFAVAILNNVMRLNGYKKRFFWIGSWFMTTTVIYFVTAVASIIYAYRKMRKPGISQEVRQLVFKRHVLSILFFLFAYLYFFISLAWDLVTDPTEELDIRNPALTGLKLVFTLQGIYLPLTRFAEPAFYELIK